MKARRSSPALATTLLLGLVAVLPSTPTTGADAAVAPRLAAADGESAVKTNDPLVFGGAAPQGSTVVRAKLLQRKADGLTPVPDATEIDVTSSLDVDGGGVISGGTATPFWPGTECVVLEVTVSFGSGGGDDPTGSSLCLRVDLVPPEIDGYELVTTDEIAVRFTEPVVDPRFPEGNFTINGTPPRDVSGDDQSAVRTLHLATPVDEDATPSVRYVPPNGGLTGTYSDIAGNGLGARNRPTAVAVDRVAPAPPVIASVDDHGVVDGRVDGNDDTPSVVIDEVSAGHRVELAVVVDDGERTIVGSGAGDADGTATFTADFGDVDDGDFVLEATSYDRDGGDANHTASTSTTTYHLDRKAPAATGASADDLVTTTVTVAFTEGVVGADDPAQWTLTPDADIVAVTGDGDTRVLHLASSIAVVTVAWTPPATDGYRDAAGNPMAAFTTSASPDALVALAAIPRAPVPEGSTGATTAVIDLTLSEPVPVPVVASWATSDGTARAGTDYTAASGVEVIPPMQTSVPVEVPVVADALDEPDETFTVLVTSVLEGVVLDVTDDADVTITDDDPLAIVSVGDAVVTEQDSGTQSVTVPVTLSRASGKAISVDWALVSGSAGAGDYVTGAGTVALAPGATASEIRVDVLGDTTYETDEVLSVRLSNAVDAELGRAVGTVLIKNNDPAPATGGGGGAVGGGEEVPSVEVSRVAGAGRVETAVEISRAVHGASATVVLARDDAYADALAGGPLAARAGAPVLLTAPTGLDEAVAAEIERLGADAAILLGGTGALSKAIEDDLRDAGVTDITRIAGANRFDTAALIADRLGGPSAYLVQGVAVDDAHGWPDAVAVSALASFQQRPILLTETGELPAETKDVLASGFTSVEIIGGTAAVSDDVADDVADLDIAVDRLAGPDRYATSAALASRSAARGLDPARTWLVTGRDWPDALVAGPATAMDLGVLLLVDGEAVEDTSPAIIWVDRWRETLTSIRLVGGTGAISEAVRTAIEDELTS